MNWFERITGFAETSYEDTRRRLCFEDEAIVCERDGRRFAMGQLETLSLAELRERANASVRGNRRTTVQCLVGDARALHRQPALAGAMFQVASQFNLLEMASPEVTPEAGVSRYAGDPTQGPACAIAAGAATIWRNYGVAVGSQKGQTAHRQLDMLAPLGATLSEQLALPLAELWTMRNGYAMCTRSGLAAIHAFLSGINEETRDALRSQLEIGVQTGAEVTDMAASDSHTVSQAFCAALPVAYTAIASPEWEPFARLVLEAAYEATLLAACSERAAGGTSTVLLTRLGGGVFGNDGAWIDAAIARALATVEYAGLDVRLVSFAEPHRSFVDLERRWRAHG